MRLPVLPAAGLAMLVGIGLSMPALAGPIADQAAMIEEAITAGEVEKSVLLAQDLTTMTIESITDGIYFTAVALTQDTAAGYGIYTDRPDSPYKAGEVIHVYVEPVGYTHKDMGNGIWNFALAADMTVLDSAGTELAAIPDFSTVSIDSHYRNSEINLALDVTLNAIDPGDYVLRFTVRDKNSDRSGTFDQPVTFVK